MKNSQKDCFGSLVVGDLKGKKMTSSLYYKAPLSHTQKNLHNPNVLINYFTRFANLFSREEETFLRILHTKTNVIYFFFYTFRIQR